MKKKIIKGAMSFLMAMTMFMPAFQTRVYAATEPEIIIPSGDTVIEVAANGSKANIVISKNTTIIFAGNATVTGNSSYSAITVQGSARLTIYVQMGSVVNVTSNGISKAGIELPSAATLIVKGRGTLNVKGGNGSSPENGVGGVPASYESMAAGNGGRGGNGGSAPGAGIGGTGGYGGTGGSGGPGAPLVYNGYQGSIGDGSSGSSGGAGGNCGTLMVFQQAKVIATAGSNPRRQTSGGSGNTFMQPSDDRWGISGGAGGGGGGSAKGSAGIGGAGSGGGGGGGGGAGAWIFSKNAHHVTGSTGGSGGAGEDSANGGGYTNNYREGAPGNYGYSGGTEVGGAYRWQSDSGAKYSAIGGSGGAGGNSPKSGNGGKIYCTATASVTSNNSNSTNMGFTSQKVTSSLILLSECDITLSQTEYDYDGTAKVPDVIITDKYTGKPIVSEKGKNYSLTYKKNTNAGTATVTIASAGNISDANHLYDEGAPKVIEFKINTITNDIILDTGSIRQCTYGESFNANIKNLNVNNDGDIVWEVVKDNTYTATANITSVAGSHDQQVTVVPTSAGKLRLKVTVKQKLNDSNSYNFYETTAYNTNVEVMTRAIDDIEITYPIIPEQTYTGALIKPQYNNINYGTDSIKFLNNKDTACSSLVEGVDYTLSYGTDETNLNAKEGDRAWVKITGINNYDGEIIKYFHIAPSDITKDKSFSLVADDVIFTGGELRSPPVVSLGSNVLPTTDYEVIYGDEAGNPVPDLINVGIKTVTIVGKGNLSGTATTTYQIKKANITNVVVKKTAPDVYFDGRNILSKPILTFNDIGLTEKDSGSGTTLNPDDYRLSYENNKEVGKATITITGENNFEGSRTMDFNVLRRPIYILPDKDQWKFYGQDELFGIDQKKSKPTYTSFLKAINNDATAETNERINMTNMDSVAHIDGYQSTLQGNLYRENKGLEDEVVGTYKYTMDSLKLKDDSTTENINKNYELRLVSNENFYTIKPYILEVEKATLSGTLGKNLWYVENNARLIAPEGYLISASNSLSSENTWTSEITFPDKDYTKEKAVYFLRNKDHKAVSDALSMSYKQDTKNPKGNIAVNTDAWTLFSSKIDYKLFLNDTALGTIYGSDETSQVFKKSYYLSDRVMTRDELDLLTVYDEGAKPLESKATYKFRESIGEEEEVEKAWINENKFSMAIDKYNEKRLIIYARVEDFAGNVTYVSSDGIVFDKDAPTLEATYQYDNVWTTDKNAKITGKVFDTNSGLKDRFVAYQIDDQAMQILKVEDDSSFVIENLPDGNYTLTISAWDQANNKAEPKVFQVKKDTKTPRILVDGNKTKISDKQKINFTVDVGASREVKLEVSYNNGAWKDVPGLSITDFFATENGTYSFKITNGAGVVSESSSITFTKIDNKKPEISFSAKDASKKEVFENGFVNNKTTVIFANKAQNLGETHYEYSVNHGPFQAVNGNLDYEAILPAFENEGVYQINARITAENGLEDSKTFMFTIDKTKPSGGVQIKDANNGIIVDFLNDIFKNQKQEVSITPTDDVSGVASCAYFVLTGKKVKNAPTDEKGIEELAKKDWTTGTSVQVEKNEQYIVYFKVIDNAGNIGYVRSDRLVINNDAPNIQIDYERECLWDNKINMGVIVEDDIPGIDKVTYTIDGTEYVGSESFTIDGLSDGTHLIQIIATDLSGNKSVRNIQVKQDNVLPEIEATEDITSLNDDNVKINITAKHDGPSGLDKVLVQKNGKDFEDISATCKPSGSYLAEENGKYVFRAVSGSGAIKDTEIVINHFQAKEVLGKVIARKQNNEGYVSSSWTNENVYLSFSNKIPNLNGLIHYLKIDNGDWKEVNAINGYVEVEATSSHKYAYKVGTVDGTLMSAPLEYEVKIDRIKPEAKLTIGEKEWNNLDGFLNMVTLGAFFEQKKPVTIISEDKESDIGKTYYFVDLVENLPEYFKGNTDASKVENYVKDGWIEGSTTTLSPNDEYIVLAKVIDNAGNITYVSSEGVIFDDVKPTIESTIIPDYWYTDDDTILSFYVDDELSGVKSGTKQINSNGKETVTIQDNGFTISTRDLQQGENIITTTVTDNSENTIEETFHIYKDSLKPTIVAKDTAEKPDIVVRKRQIEVAPVVGASGISKVEVRTPNGRGWENITETYKDDYTATENGTYWFRVTNNANISSDAYALILGDISQDVPILSVVANKLSGPAYIEDTWSEEDVIVQFISQNFTDEIAGYYYKIDNNNYQKLDIIKDNGVRFKAIDGHHTYTMKCVLKNGLESDEESIEIQLDMKAPLIHVNNNLSTWVKGTTLLEVEVKDDESGVNNYGLSFDAGETWQQSNKINVYANKLVQVHARDKVNNEAVKPVDIVKIDSQGPTVTHIQQEGSELSRTRNIKLSADDYKDIENNAGSGVKDITVMTSFPYKNGIYYPNPDVTFVMEKDDSSWKTKDPITVESDGTNNIWIVTEDQVGNQKIYSTKVENMIGTPDPDKPVNPDNPIDPSQPVEPDKPINPGTPDISGPNETGGNSSAGSNQTINKDKITSTEVVGNTNFNNVQKDEQGKQENIIDNQTLKDLEKIKTEAKQKENSVSSFFVNAVYNNKIIWILLLLAMLWLGYRYKKYHNVIKKLKLLEEKGGEDGNEE